MNSTTKGGAVQDYCCEQAIETQNPSMSEVEIFRQGSLLLHPQTRRRLEWGAPVLSSVGVPTAYSTLPRRALEA